MRIDYPKKEKPVHDECLICGAPLIYREHDTEMVCALCHKTEIGRTVCEQGHYVCDACHMAGVDAVFGVCLKEPSDNPIDILQKLMALPFCHMHGPEHHIMVGAALLTAYKNAGGHIDLESALAQMQSRGRQVPGGVCGFWGACGAGISAGIFMAIVTDSTPLVTEAWGLSHGMTAQVLHAIGMVGGPRCCKRDSYLAIREAVAFTKEHLGVEMGSSAIRCHHSAQNNQCISARCPFYSPLP